MKKIILLLLCIATAVQAQEVKVSSGKVQRFAHFKSQFVDPRHIDVWLPAGYSNSEKYAVLYMHDGNMLFDAETTWNKQAWEVDEVAAKLMAEAKTKKFIVVGIWNNGAKRHSEYFPQKPFENLKQVQKDTVTAQLQKAGRTTTTFKPISDLYLTFVVTELKPFIDKTFSTKTDKGNTFIAGSSMGGLISMYAICEYPKIFGGAACLSTHWPGTFAAKDNPIPEAFIDYLRIKLPQSSDHKIYFDCGDQTLDAMYPTLQKNVDQVMMAKGFTAAQWQTEFFHGKDHSEKSWSERLDIPLLFLLKQ